MRVLSNVEFEKLVAEQAPRLRVLARQRCEANPSGFISVDDLGIYTKAFEFSGDCQAAKWLKNLIVLAKNGKLARIRKGTTTWEDHVEQVTAMHAAKEVKFNIGQHVYVEDEGRYGSVVDYIPDIKEYLVVLDPFQVKQYKKKDLEKVASIAKKKVISTDDIAKEALRTKKQVTCPECGYTFMHDLDTQHPKFNVPMFPPSTHMECPQCGAAFNVSSPEYEGPDGPEFLHDR